MTIKRKGGEVERFDSSGMPHHIRVVGHGDQTASKAVGEGSIPSLPARIKEAEMPNCTSCGQPIPEGQGSSCSMCYGDIDYGSDGYYRDHMEQQEQEQE